MWETNSIMQVNDVHQILVGKTVLVVEDDPDSLEVAVTLLEFHQMHILTATNGKLALEAIAQTTPDFIISDLSMPEMSGWDLIKHLKADRRTMDIPVIALTAHAMNGDRQKAIAAGFHNYLIKPLNPESFIADLVSVVSDVLV